MAKPTTKLASSKPVSTKWLNNAMRSIGISTKNVLKQDFAPNVYTAVESGFNTSKSIISTLRNNASGTNQLNNQLSNNKYVKFARMAYRNAISDLKTGNFHNDERQAEEFLGDFGSDKIESTFEDAGFSFDDDGADVNVNVINATNNNDAMFAMTTQLQKQTEATLKTSQANMNAMIAVNSAAMMQTQQIGASIISGLDAINKNLSVLIEYNNSNMNKFIEASVAYYEKMGAKADKGSGQTSDKIHASQVLGATGSINLSDYKKYVKQHLKDGLRGTGLDFANALLDEQSLNLLAASPLTFASDTLVKFMMPKILTSTIKGVEETFSNFMPSLLHRLADWGVSDAGMMGTVKKFVGKTFGLRMDRTEKLSSTSSIEKGAVPFDGQTKHAITEIITKELREQTSYLKAIANHYKIDTNAAKNDADVFDFRTGKYIKSGKATDNILDLIRYAVVNSMDSGTFGKNLRKYEKAFTDEKEQKTIHNTLDELMIRLERLDKLPTINKDTMRSKDSDFYKLIDSLSTDKATKTKVLEMFKDLTERNPNAIMDLSRSMFSARKSRNDTIADIQNNASYYNLYAAQGLNDTKIDDLILQRYANGTIGDIKIDKKKLSQEKLSKYKLSNAKNIKLSEAKSDVMAILNAMIEGDKSDDESDSGSTSSSSTNAKVLAKDKLKGKYVKRRSPKELKSLYAGVDISTVYDLDEKDKDKAGTFKQIMYQANKGLSEIAMGIVHGSSSEAFSSFTKMMSAQFSTIWNKFSDSFLTPFKHSLIGTKDKDSNFFKDGIFAGVLNRFKDVGGMLTHHITGKEYTDSKGVTHKIKDGDTSTVVGNLKKIGATVKEGVMEKLFGKKVLDKDGNITQESKGGILSGFKDSISKGFKGWTDALFGQKTTDDQNKKIKQSITKHLTDSLPDAATGTAVGAGVGMMSGGLLGTLIGGPLGGAAMGTAVGFLSRSEKFQNTLFGPKDENGERMGGIISKKTQDFIKENKSLLAGSAAVGAVTGSVTGGGVLGTLVGGPVAGAILGVGTSIIAKSEMFKKFWFGDKEAGQLGIKNHIDNWVKKFGRDKKDNADGGKLAGMMAIGTAGGGLIGSLFGGPIVGSVLGLGASILAQKDNFHEWLFGSTDEEGNRKEGVLGKFRNMLAVNVFRPIGNMFKDVGADIKTFLKYDVFQRLNFITEQVGDRVSSMLSSLTNGLVDRFSDIGKYIKDTFLNGFIEKAGKILAPVTNAATAAAKGIYTFGKKLLTTPINLIYNIVSPISNAVGKVVGGVAKTAFKGIDLLLVKPINTLVVKPLAAVTKGVGKVVSAPFKLLGKVAENVNEKLTGFADHFTLFVSKMSDDLKEFIKNSGPAKWLNRTKERTKEWMTHVKDATKEFMSPVTTFAKQALDDIRGAIKKRVNTFFKSLLNILNPINWMKGIAKGGRKLGAIFRGEDPEEAEENYQQRKKDKKANKKESYFGRIWRETANGYNQDRSDTLEYDEEGRIVGSKLTYAQRVHNARIDRTSATLQNKQDALARKKLNKNEKLIAKYTNNQASDWTEENKAKAEYEAKKRGITINWEDVETRKTSQEKFNDKSLDVQTETKSLVQDIRDILRGESGQSDSSATLASDQSKTKKKTKICPNCRTKNKLNARECKFCGMSFKSARRQKIEAGMASMNDEGIEEGLSALENSPVGTRFTLSNFLSKFGIKGYASGTDNADGGPKVVGERGPEILNMPKGSQVYNGTKSIPVVVTGMAEKVKSGFLGLFSKIKGFFSGKRKSSVDHGDVRTLAARAASAGGGANIAGIVSSLSGGHAGEDLEDNVDAVLDTVEAGKFKDKARDLSKTPEELQRERDAEEQRTTLNNIAENTKNQADSQKDFTSQWSSIFSKKGLITAGLLLAAPLIIKAIPTIVDVVKNILPLVQSIGKGISGFVSGVANMFGWTMDTGALGDGDTIGDKIQENTTRVGSLVDTDKSVLDRIKGFVKNENGQIDHQSDANAKLLVSTAGDAAFKLGGGKVRLKKQGISGAIDSVKNIGKITYSADDLVKAGLANNTDEVVEMFGKGRISTKAIAKAGLANNADEAFDVIHGGLKANKSKGLISKLGSKISNSKAGTAVKAGATKLVDSGSTMIKTVISKITTWLDDVVKAVGKKMGKEIGEGVVSGLLKNVSDVVTKFFSKISAKISAIFTKEGAIAASNAAFGLGVAIKATEITLNAINGASGAARLFQVDQDYVDGKMTTIATLIGAAQGTMVGSIVDVVNELFASVTGVDFITELATLIYNVWAGEDKAAVLKAGKEEFKLKYEEYQDTELKKQYETQSKAGLIDGKSLSYDQFKEEVQSGKRKASYDSFIDYNDKQHKTLGAKALSGIGTGLKKVGKDIGNLWSSAFGKKEKYLTDANGNKYYDNKDGTYQIISATGEDLGYISKEALPEGLTEEKVKTKGSFSKFVSSVKEMNKYNIKEVGKNLLNKGKDKLVDALNNKAPKLAKFLVGKKTTGWRDDKNGYYLSNGNTFDYYNSNGDQVRTNIPADEVTPFIESGLYTEDKNIKVDGTLKTTLKTLSAAKISATNFVRDTVSGTFNSIKESTKVLWDNLKSDGIIKGVKKFFSDTTTTAWFDQNGCYYKLNGETYDYYNPNNDLIESGIAAETVEAMKRSGFLTESEIVVNSAAKDAVTGIKNAVADAWQNAKTTVGNAWNKVKSWITGNKDESQTLSTGGALLGGPLSRKPRKGVLGLQNIGGSVTAQDLISEYGISSAYGTRNIDGREETHGGIDLTKPNNSPVLSFTSGKVFRVVNNVIPDSGSLNSTANGGFGNMVVIKDENGNYNYYAHLNGVNVQPGQIVNVGDKIGILGNTGRSTGPHLHYEVRNNTNSSNNTIDPSTYLNVATTMDSSSSTSSTGTSGSSSITDIFSSLTGFLSEFASRAWNGFASGKFDSDYSTYFAENGITRTTTSADTSSGASVSTTNNAPAIWKYYKAQGVPDKVIAAIMANMYAESGLNPKNLQNSYEKSLGHTDSSYTSAVDSGAYTNFVHDSAGYGLVQWTYHSLKEALLNYANKKNASIGDLDMQLEFLLHQLSTNYPSTWQKMCNARNAEEAAAIMLKEFERPAVLNTSTRMSYAKQYYDLYANDGGTGGATISKRRTGYDIPKTHVGGPDTSIDSINYTSKDSSASYTTATNASKYIETSGDGKLMKAVNIIIGLLESITSNTGSASSKLDLLSELKKSSVSVGGNTTNYVTNNNQTTSTGNAVGPNGEKKISRNQKLAEKIALGV